MNVSRLFSVDRGSSTGLTDVPHPRLRRPEPLGPKIHQRSNFDSGSPHLDDWLRVYSTQNRRLNTAATWVVADEDRLAAGYVRLSMTSLHRAAAPSVVAKHAPDPVPALLIGRLAVDRSWTGLGVGTTLVSHVLATAVELNERAACRAVVVSAVGGDARSWWEWLGFHPFNAEDPEIPDLYLLTSEIEATIRSLG